MIKYFDKDGRKVIQFGNDDGVAPRAKAFKPKSKVTIIKETVEDAIKKEKERLPAKQKDEVIKQKLVEQAKTKVEFDESLSTNKYKKPTANPSISKKRSEEAKKYHIIYGNGKGAKKWYGKSDHGKNFMPKLKKYKFDSLLDVGTGKGVFPTTVIENKLCKTVHGIDIAKSVKQKTNGWIFKQAPAHMLPYKNKEFDVITCFDVLEHLIEEDVETALSEFARVAKKIVVLSVCFRKSINEVNGENLHATIKPQNWWMDKFSKVGKVEKWGNYYILKNL